MPTRTQQCDIQTCAYASHGDTKHIVLYPADPGECFDFSVRFQGVVVVFKMTSTVPFQMVGIRPTRIQVWLRDKYEQKDLLTVNITSGMVL